VIGIVHLQSVGQGGGVPGLTPSTPPLAQDRGKR